MAALHPITAQSFAIIDAEIGPHDFDSKEYRVIQRVIHSTADFEFKHLVRFEHGAMASGLAALGGNVPVIVDVQMVRVAVAGLLASLGCPLLCALDEPVEVAPGQTRTEAGLLALIYRYPEAIYVIGNAPTALLALVDAVSRGEASPALIIGVPVGFVQVVQAKQALAQTRVPQIRTEGRKGGSPVAAAIVNALVTLVA